jgi:hypothetical protein
VSFHEKSYSREPDELIELTGRETDMSSLNLVAICTKCSHPNALGSISELRFKQGQFRAPDRAQEFTCVSCGEKSTVKERDLQLICGQFICIADCYTSPTVREVVIRVGKIAIFDGRGIPLDIEISVL